MVYTLDGHIKGLHPYLGGRGVAVTLDFMVDKVNFLTTFSPRYFIWEVQRPHG